MNTFKYVIILGDGTRIDSYDEYCEEGLFESYSEAENEAIIEMKSFIQTNQMILITHQMKRLIMK